VLFVQTRPSSKASPLSCGLRWDVNREGQVAWILEIIPIGLLPLVNTDGYTNTVHLYYFLRLVTCHKVCFYLITTSFSFVNKFQAGLPLLWITCSVCGLFIIEGGKSCLCSLNCVIIKYLITCHFVIWSKWYFIPQTYYVPLRTFK